MFSKLFKKKKEAAPGAYLTVNLNARVQPMHRGDVFEDPLMERLSASRLGSVEGGGTLMSESGEIQSCDIEIELKDLSDGTLEFVKRTLEDLGAPKGSKLILPDSRVIPVGTTEGLAVYLNGTDLPNEVYQQCDSNHVYSELERLIEGEGQVLSYWEGSSETAFYLYGKSFERMKSLIADFLASYPLCQNCRVEQIA